MTVRPPPRVVLTAIAVFIATAATIAIVLQPSREDLEDLFGGGGALGPAIYSVTYAALTVAFIPGLPLTLAAGALYGAVGGAAVSVVGATIGATLAFLLARRGTRGAIEQVKGKRLAAIEERLSGKGLIALLTLRLIPVFPFNALNYAAGASSIGVRDYVIATFFGIIPGAVAYSALGAGLDDPASPLFIGAAVLAIALALVARRFSRRVGPDTEQGTPMSGGETALRPAFVRLAGAAAFFAVALAVFVLLFTIGLFH